MPNFSGLKAREVVDKDMTQEDQLPRKTPVIPARFLTKQFQFLLDLMILVAAFMLAYLLRFDFAIPPDYVYRMLVQLPCVVLLQVVTLNVTGVHSFVWRYVGLAEVKAFFMAAVMVFALLVI